MKRILISSIAILLFTRLCLAQSLDSQRTMRTHIAELLALMPAQNTAEIKNSTARIALLGKDGLVEMITGIGRAGSAASIEYALGGFSYYVMQPGEEDMRAMAVRAYCEALDKLSDARGKSLMIRQLEITGNDGSVDCLQKYLSVDSLCDPAVRALIKINTNTASRALLNALKNSKRRCTSSLIQAIGDTRYKGAAKELPVFLTDTDQGIRKATLYAIANIADPASRKLLEEYARKARYEYEQTNATSSYLLFAERLLESSSRQIALEIAETLLKNSKSQVKTAALKLLVDVQGEKSVPRLVDAMDSNDPEYRAAALRYARRFNTPPTNARWVKKLSGSSDEIKIGIIAMLGQAKAASALPAITDLLRSGNGKVRSAAINSARLTGDDKTLDDLLRVMRTGDDLDVLNVKNAVGSMKGDSIPDRLAAAFPSMASNGQAAIIALLGARSATSYTNLILIQTSNHDRQIKNAAISALKYVALKKDLPALFNLMDQNIDSFQQTEIQQAIIVSVRDMKNVQQQSAAILDQMSKVPKNRQQDFFIILASLGGEENLVPVLQAFEHGDSKLKQAALSALTNWSDASAASELLKISLNYQNSYDTTALAGYIYSIRKSAFPDIQKYLMLREGMQASGTTSQKRRVLQELSRLDCLPALLYTGKFLDTPMLGGTAADFVINMCLGNKKLSGNLVQNLLKRSMEFLRGPESEYQKTEILKHLNEMPGDNGFISLFNGKNLKAWEAKAGNVVPAGWKVHDGEIIFDGTGQNIFTVGRYGDFELFVDYKTAKADEKKVSRPFPLSDLNSGQWNNLRIIRHGESVSVYLNGSPVIDKAGINDYEKLHLPVLIRENVGLQGQNIPITFRDIYIKEFTGLKPHGLSRIGKYRESTLFFDGTNINR